MSNAISMTAVLVLAILASPAQAAGEKSASQIIESYVADFRDDPEASKPIMFGVRVSGEGGGDWHVEVSGKKEPGGDAFHVELKDGFPEKPCVYFTVDLPTLREVDAGKLNALTAMAKAFSTDKAPMDVEATDGFVPPNKDYFTKEFIPFTFHFWTRGTPEIVLYGGNLTRETHGAHAAVLYYEKGLRSAWAQIRKGDHVNADTRSRTNPFSSMLVITAGKCEAKLGGKNVILEKGQMIFIPAGMTHEFWNNNEEPAEVILLMFGEGA